MIFIDYYGEIKLDNWPSRVTTAPARIPRNGVNCIGTGVSEITILVLQRFIIDKNISFNLSNIFPNCIFSLSLKVAS